MRERRGTLAVCLAVCAAFAFDPFGFDRWVFAKELVMLIAALCALRVSSPGQLPRWFYWWLAAAAAVLTVAAALGSTPVAQWFGRWPRYEGVFTLSVYALAVWLGARLLGGAAAEHRARAARIALAVALGVTAFIAVLETFGLRPISSDLARPGSLLGNASDLGAVGVIGLALFLSEAVTRFAELSGRVERGVAGLGLTASVVLVAASASRAALMAAVVVVGLSAVVGLRGTSKLQRRTWMLTIAASAVGLGALSFAIPSTQSRLTGASATAVETVTNRLALWADSVQLFFAAPATGAGPSGFADAITAHLNDQWYANVGVGSWIESPHNILLQVAAAGGVLAIGLVLTLAVLWMRALRQNGVAGPFGMSGVIALVGVLVALLTGFTAPGPMMLACLIFGASIAQPGRALSTGWARLRAAALVAWALVLVAAIAADHAFGAGVSALHAGRSAESSFAVASALRPWDADLPLMVTELYAAQAQALGKSSPSAPAWAEQAVSRLPASTRALVASAIVDQYRGKAQLAEAQLRRAAVLSPTDPQVFHFLGGVLLLEHQNSAAVVALERAHQLAPGDAGIEQTLAYAQSAAAR